MIIAVDGPAASGKGTIARALAAHYGLPCLDTGLLYRAVGLQVLRAGGDPEKEADALAACAFDDALLDDRELKTEAAGAAASKVSAIPAVRAALIDRQRAFAARPGGAVLDGRDIGTVIAPHADAKLYVKATPTVRARRRHDELVGLGHEISFDKVLADIRARDLRDTTRATAPLRPADDAALLDTSYMDIDAAVDRAISLVDAQIGNRRQANP
ncbi:cytidylate kinase [Sphingomonas laterariae]|uniref:Cytidylate kinase n=1 Tax=Edaphosphingomonas laterariae TaxID=861865 RepID=A0A239ESJ0_9SPHN|nr:(d)CMP kinase [Sphingomonas laterariae]SNS47549.1 cytidylate kinase [Sphingomonas laterariae]